MRVVIQKVKQASVTVENQLVSSINRGLMILVGISTTDTLEDVSKLSKKIVNLRLFETRVQNESENVGCWTGKPWSQSVLQDPELSILAVSQFTLYGTIKKGTKPDFHKAAKGPDAKKLYDELLAQLRRELGSDDRVKDGKFGEMMDVALVNDGPVTIVWDTRENSI